mmetsp:Transcript_4600/g.7913  ORF Transcript_4600/g.7913 Transcript_4600/m.7913 type:complete len:331 (-) Transcript_4600:515-1507(-)
MGLFDRVGSNNELRQRKKGEDQPTVSFEDMKEKAGMLFKAFFAFVDFISPIISAFIKVASLFLAICPTEILIALFGLALCFFGGTFVVTIAAAEAWRASGWSTTKTALKILWDEWNNFREKSHEDDDRDDDGDGIPDVQQVDGARLASRKLNLFLVTCKDPNQVNVAMSGIWTSFLAVLATLKIQFARTIALGVSIGQMLHGPMDRIFLPVLTRVMPQEYKKWCSPIVDWICKAIAISIAWFIQRVISAVQSGMRGGLMFSRQLMSFASRKGILKIKDEDTYLDEIVGFTIAGFGIWFQLSHFFELPFPWNLFLLPVRILEYVLMWIVSD